MSSPDPPWPVQHWDLPQTCPPSSRRMPTGRSTTRCNPPNSTPSCPCVLPGNAPADRAYRTPWCSLLQAHLTWVLDLQWLMNNRYHPHGILQIKS
jgi:hypothetical protein